MNPMHDLTFPTEVQESIVAYVQISQVLNSWTASIDDRDER
jgi:hypothetical protein